MAHRRSDEPCIYCGSTPANAKEHWILRGMGRFKGYEPLLGRLCNECNVALGRSIDQAFCRTGPAATFRHAFGIRGRHDRPSVNPMHYRAAHTQPPSVMRMRSTDDKHELLVELARYRDTDYVKPLRQIVVEAGNGDLVPVPFPNDWDAAMLRQALEARGLAGAKLFALYSDPEEREAAIPVLRELFRPFNIPCYHRSARAGQELSVGEIQPVLASWTFDDEYYRAVVKTAFHYLLKFCPLVTGREDQFERVRRFIRHGEGNPFDFVRSSRDSFTALSWGHAFVMRAAPSSVEAVVQFFVAPHIRVPCWEVRLLAEPMPSLRDWRSGHLLVLFEEEREGHDGEIVPIPEVRDDWFGWDRAMEPTVEQPGREEPGAGGRGPTGSQT